MLAVHEARTYPKFDPKTSAYHLAYDPESHWPVSTAIVLGIASLTEIDPLEMLPLNGVVDPNALDFHVRSNSEEAVLSFEFYGHEVSVRADGHVEFAPVDGDESDAGPKPAGRGSGLGEH